jgi:hypothetical protein
MSARYADVFERNATKDVFLRKAHRDVLYKCIINASKDVSVRNACTDVFKALQVSNEC